MTFCLGTIFCSTQMCWEKREKVREISFRVVGDLQFYCLCVYGNTYRRITNNSNIKQPKTQSLRKAYFPLDFILPTYKKMMPLSSSFLHRPISNFTEELIQPPTSTKTFNTLSYRCLRSLRAKIWKLILSSPSKKRTSFLLRVHQPKAISGAIITIIFNFLRTLYKRNLRPIEKGGVCFFAQSS